MSAYQCLAGEAVHGARRFRPTGPLTEVHHGARPNPAKRISGGGFAARLFVGLKVGQEEKWKAADIVAIIKRVRKEQKKLPDASILMQQGIYEDRSGALVVEPSVQIVIIDTIGEKKGSFVGSMKNLGEVLAVELQQEVVILEIQRRGIVTDVYSVTPPKAKKVAKKKVAKRWRR